MVKRARVKSVAVIAEGALPADMPGFVPPSWPPCETVRPSATSGCTAIVASLRITRRSLNCAAANTFARKLEAQFTELLGRLTFDDEVLEWVRDALHASHVDERREHEEAIRRHQTEYKRLDERIHAMYVDKLDGLVDVAFFERMSNQWR
jgi:hypothetical protein